MADERSGQRVLVTAGAAGIGLAVAERFLGAGAQVMVCDIDADALAAVPSNITGVICDVADAGQVAGLFERIEAEMGGLDVLINSAGIDLEAPSAEVTDAQWEESRGLSCRLCGRRDYGKQRRPNGGVFWGFVTCMCRRQESKPPLLEI